MDTIKVQISDVLIIKQFLLKFEELRSPEWTIKPINMQRCGFDEALSCLIGGKNLYFAWRTSHRLEIQIHLSQWNTFHDACTFIAPFFDGDIEPFLTGKLKRLDLCLDLYVPFQTMRSKLFVPRVIKIVEVSGKTRTIQLGKGPKQLVVYEKAPSKTCDDNSSALQKPRTRLELRFKGRKIPIKNLSEIANPAISKAFDHVKLLELKNRDLQQLDKRIAATLDSYEFRLKDFSAMELRKQHGGTNFDRRFAKWLQKAPDIDISDLWLTKLKSYLSEVS